MSCGPILHPTSPSQATSPAKPSPSRIPADASSASIPPSKIKPCCCSIATKGVEEGIPGDTGEAGKWF